ncbi:reverse transcriptase domain-containing protein [Virgibacillus oceani]
MSAYKDFNKLFRNKKIEGLYKEKVILKPSTGIDGINKETFEKNITYYINVINRKVTNNTFKFTPYKEKLITKGKGKAPRVISIPTIRDKLTLSIVHRILSNAFAEDINFELVQTVISKVKETLNNSNYNYFIKIDIEKFYDNINHDILISKVKRKVRKKELINLISNAIKTPTISSTTRKPYTKNKRGVPQGLSISNILANIYMNNLDRVFENQNAFAYFRYVDDVLIICNKAGKEKIESKLEKHIKNLGLTYNKDKKQYGFLSQEFSFLGYNFNNKIAGVREANIFKLETSLVEVFTRYKYSNYKRTSEFIWNLNIKITGGIIDKNKYGWLFFYSQIDDLSILYHLDWFVGKLFKRFEINNISEKNIKKFVRTYNEILYNRSASNYIPNFDEYETKQKKELLVNVFNLRYLRNADDEKVERNFRNYIFNSLKKLEQDIQHFS